MYERVALIIPAKGDSERLPGKNKLKINGKPLWEIALEKAYKLREQLLNAQSCKTVAVYVSTECKRIMSDTHSRWPDVGVLHRPRNLSDDFYDVMNWELRDHKLDSFHDLVFHIHCTAPLLSVDSMRKTVCCLLTGIFDSCFTATREVLYTWSSTGGAWFANYPVYGKLPKSQDMRPFAVETHGMYGVRIEKFLAAGNRYCGNVTPVFIPKIEGFDVDDAEDFRIVRKLAGDLSGGSS